MSVRGKKNLPVTIVFVLLSVSSISQTESGDVVIEIPYEQSTIQIDGAIDDWSEFSSLTFSDTALYFHTPVEFPFEGEMEKMATKALLSRSRNTVSAMCCWNLSGLYFAFRVEDRHLMAEIREGNDNPEMYYNDGIEIYIDTKNDSKAKMDLNDYQFLVDIVPSHIVFKGDRKLQDSLSFSVPKEYGLNILIEYAVSQSGTVNDTLTDDVGFTMEVRLPFEAIGIIPKSGMKFRLDLCNNDNDYFLAEYEETDIHAALRPFSWSGFNNFGYPGYWKTVTLTGSPGWFEALPASEKKTWLIAFIALSLLTITILGFLMYRLNRLKRLPAQTEVAPSGFLFIGGEKNPGPSVSMNRNLLQKATDFIAANRTQSLNSEEVARNLGISLRKLQRITKEEMQCTPTSFIYIVKLNLAAEYLKGRQGNISETAYNFGFSDPSYFSKIFKKHFGVSPADYLDKNDKPL
jgi:AraC-like DNA-binding protein